MKKLTQAEYLPIDKLKPFEGHPFYVKDDDDMEQLTESIRQQGVLNPIMVQPLDSGEYEVISGHRRLHACKKAGIEMIPAFICSMDRSEAVVAMVDSNLHREKLLPSEKAFAYKMKMDALKHQGTSSQLGTKQRTDALVAAQTNESRNQVQRYIRLTNLIPGILKLVDEQKMALTPAVEISYLTEEEQYDLLDTIKSEDCTPSLSQALRMREFSKAGKLSMDVIFSIMTQPKANQEEKISFKVADLRPYFPRHFNTAQMMQEIVIALKERQQRLARMREQER
jgi:ParB family chromosome partitioning protein